MIYLGKDDIEGLVSMEETIEAVEKAFLKHSQGKTVYPPKDQFMLPTDEWKWWGFMPVYVEGMGVACKIVCDYPENKKEGLPTIIATIVLCDVETGQVKAIMDGGRLTAMRTGALGAIAAKYLAREDARTGGILGCGVQARTQLEALSKVRKLEKVKIYDLKEESMDRFISDMRGLGLDIEKSNADGVLGADIVVAATVSQKPVVFGDKIKAGTHVTSIGAHTPEAGELDDTLMAKAKVVIDSPDCKKSGDLTDFKGELTEIKDVIAGKKVRASADDITVFKSVGTALQDVAIANLVYEKAKGKGVGKSL
jgi:ornithine cyclodeaminase/alanine dehydrogenase-like protein (mu-crystallin family)